MKLNEFFNKNVKITDIDNEVWNGHVETYTPAIDSEEELDEISIRKKGGEHLINFNESEIKSIEVI